MIPSISLPRRLRLAIVLPVVLTLGSCATVVSSLTSQMANDLANTILNSRDIDTVREGVPAYLLMIDSFLRSSPDDPDLLIAAATLNGSFSIFTQGDRASLLTDKALGYALKAGCVRDKRLCGARTQPFKEFRTTMDDMGVKAVPVLYAMGVAWTSYIQANSDDWNAIAELGRVKYLMERVIELDETWENGGPHLYLAGLETALPPSMGGNLEKGREHFERAIELSEGKYLMTRVIYAQQYARFAFDKELHDRLLREVLDADPVVEGMTLTNMVAKERARELLDESDEYF